MGQYYKTVNIGKKQEATTPDQWPKLMETSWMGNNAMDGLLIGLLLDGQSVSELSQYNRSLTTVDFPWGSWSRDIVVRCGDYYDEDPTIYNEAVETTYKFTKGLDYKELYLINHTKKQYISMKRYLAQADLGCEWDKSYTVHPLPLLIALGNGGGGGNYYGINQHLVGSWGLDAISTSFYKPADSYSEILPFFKE
jgi:hypothetical protein